MVLLASPVRLPEMLTPEPSVPLPFTVVLFRVLLPLMSTPAPLPVAFPVMLPSVMLPEMLTPLPLPEALPLIWPPFTEPLMSTPEPLPEALLDEPLIKLTPETLPQILTPFPVSELPVMLELPSPVRLPGFNPPHALTVLTVTPLPDWDEPLIVVLDKFPAI